MQNVSNMFLAIVIHPLPAPNTTNDEGSPLVLPFGAAAAWIAFPFRRLRRRAAAAAAFAPLLPRELALFSESPAAFISGSQKT